MSVTLNILLIFAFWEIRLIMMEKHTTFSCNSSGTQINTRYWDKKIWQKIWGYIWLDKTGQNPQRSHACRVFLHWTNLCNPIQNTYCTHNQLALLLLFSKDPIHSFFLSLRYAGNHYKGERYVEMMLNSKVYFNVTFFYKLRTPQSKSEQITCLAQRNW